MDNSVTLNDISPGEYAIIKRIKTDCKIKRRLFDIGIVNGTKINCVGQSMFGDPKAFDIRGAVIAIRSEECKKIFVNRILEAQ